MRPPSSSRSIFGCANSFWPRARSRSMRPWRLCSIPAAAAPRKDTSGPSPVTTGHAAGRTRLPSPTATLRVAARSTPSKLLEHYRGIVQCDGHAAYKSIADAACGEAITLAFCWAHLRRRFFDIVQDGSAPDEAGLDHCRCRGAPPRDLQSQSIRAASCTNSCFMLRIQPLFHLCCHDQRRHNGGALGTAFGAGKEPL